MPLENQRLIDALRELLPAVADQPNSVGAGRV
jgi:hypothetical protein